MDSKGGGRTEFMPDTSTIKRGVSLYSLQDAYGRGGLGLEGCIEAVESTGATGIEILSDQMIRGAQNASEETLAHWDAIIERHPLELVANDIFINSSKFANRWLTLDEQVASLEADLRLAHRLGFHLVRVVSRTDPAVVRPALGLAQELDVTMAVEIHAGMSFDHPMTAAWIAQMKELDVPHVGIVVDFGIFCQRHPRIATEYFRGFGLSQDVAAYVEDVYASGSDGRQLFTRDPAYTDVDRYIMPEELTRLFKSPIDEFYCTMTSGYENTPLEVLDEYAPWIKSFHGKFWEMVDDPQGPYEQAIDYKRVIDRLKQIGWSGYICSEYEGQRFVTPGEPVDDIGQLRAHQQMLETLINGK